MNKFRLIIALVITLSTAVIDKTSYAWDLTKLSEKYRGQSLNISLMIGYEWNKILVDELIPEFEKQTGIDVVISYVPYNDVLEEHKYLLSAGSAKYDLLHVDDTWFPAYVKDLEPVESLMKTHPALSAPDLDLADIIPELKDGYSSNGQLYCIPQTFEFPALFIRKDLFKAAGFVDKDGNVIPPTNIEEYYQYAKALTKDADGDGNADVYGTTLHGNRTGIFDEMISFYWGEGGNLFDKNLKPAVDVEKMNKVLGYYQKIYTEGYAPPESTNWELGEAANAFRLGKVAMSWNWSMVAAWLYDPKISSVYDKIAVVKLFKGDANTKRYLREASTALCIPKYTPKKEAALLFVQWISSKQNQERFYSPKYLIHPVRLSLLSSAEYQKRAPYAVLQSDVAKSKSIRLCPKFYDYPSIDQIGTARFQQVMIGKMTPDDATKGFIHDLMTFMDSKKYYQGNIEYPDFISGSYE